MNSMPPGRLQGTVPNSTTPTSSRPPKGDPMKIKSNVKAGDTNGITVSIIYIGN